MMTHDTCTKEILQPPTMNIKAEANCQDDQSASVNCSQQSITKRKNRTQPRDALCSRMTLHVLQVLIAAVLMITVTTGTTVYRLNDSNGMGNFVQ